jgi:hypothetical protein
MYRMSCWTCLAEILNVYGLELGALLKLFVRILPPDEIFKGAANVLGFAIFGIDSQYFVAIGERFRYAVELGNDAGMQQQYIDVVGSEVYGLI